MDDSARMSNANVQEEESKCAVVQVVDERCLPCQTSMQKTSHQGPAIDARLFINNLFLLLGLSCLTLRLDNMMVYQATVEMCLLIEIW